MVYMDDESSSEGRPSPYFSCGGSISGMNINALAMIEQPVPSEHDSEPSSKVLHAVAFVLGIALVAGCSETPGGVAVSAPARALAGQGEREELAAPLLP